MPLHESNCFVCEQVRCVSLFAYRLPVSLPIQTTVVNVCIEIDEPAEVSVEVIEAAGARCLVHMRHTEVPLTNHPGFISRVTQIFRQQNQLLRQRGITFQRSINTELQRVTAREQRGPSWAADGEYVAPLED